MKCDRGLSETVSVILIIGMVLILAIVIAAFVLGVNIIPQNPAYIAVDIQKVPVSGTEAISIFHRAGDTASLKNITDQQQYVLSFYVDTTSGSYRIQPPSGLDIFRPGTTLFVYNTSTGIYKITNNSADLVSAPPPISLTSVRLVDEKSHQLIAQWKNSTGFSSGGTSVLPTVTGISPVTGSTDGGTIVTITGTNLLGAAAGGANGVTFGGAAATGVSVVSGTSITATTSAHAAGAVNVVVTTPNGTVTGTTGAFTYVDPPAFGSIAPPTGPTGGGTVVTITGTNLIGATAVTFDGIAATGISVVSGTSITATTPGHATAGLVNVIVTTPNGTATGTGAYTYVALPTVTSIAPPTGPTVGGTGVTITGTDLIGATSVTFDGIAATGISVVSGTSITATTPGHAAGAVNVVVTTPNGTATGTGAYTYVGIPAVTSVAPPTGPTVGGTGVTITGTDLIGATSVTFDGIAATGISVVSGTSITATTPGHVAGAVNVVVTTPNGTATGTGAYTYVGIPTFGSVAPPTGSTVGGTGVTITGTNLIGTTSVTFDGIAATGILVVSGTSITATTPGHAAGAVNVVVTTFNGTATGTGAYTYVGIPTVTGRLPTSGPVTGGTSVAITGSGFTGATAVRFGVTSATSYTVNSATSITATSPAGTGTVDITVTTPGGTSTISAADQYTYAAIPAVTGRVPTTGTVSGGTSVAITGSGFTGATAVRFGVTSAASYTVNSATSITAISPAGTGTVDITVTTPGGTSTTSAADLYTYTYPVPTVTGRTPTSGPIAGGTSVAITGTGFTGATAVRFGGTSATSYTVNSATSITATSPAGTGTVDITVITPGGTSATSAADRYTYAAIPTVTGRSPTSGPTAGGTSVAITGTGFTGATSVRFGGTSATSYTVNSATSITATSPAGTGTVDITVITPGGTSATSAADRYTYYPPPTVTGISPNTGNNDNNRFTVTITGTNFRSGATVTQSGAAGGTFTIDQITYVNPTTMTARFRISSGVPIGYRTIRVTNSDSQYGELAGVFNVY